MPDFFMASTILHSKKLLIFDFDGTLVDSMADFGVIAGLVMARHYACDENWARQKYRATSGLPFPLQLEKIFPDDRRNTPAAEDFARQKEIFYEDAPFFEGTFDVLRLLRERGFLLAVSSNNEPSLIEKRLGLHRDLFDRILGYRPGFLKGDHHFRWIRHFFNIGPHEMVFVGDSLHDAKMAVEHGIDFIARAGTFAKEDFISLGHQRIIFSLPDIFNYLGNGEEKVLPSELSLLKRGL